MSVLVVGGGITGLVAAWSLGRAGVPTLLVEATDRLGGKVRTERADGFLIEHGPDSLITYRPAAVELARELGLGDSIIRVNEPRSVSIRAGGRSVPMPDGMGLVLPTRMRPFVTTGLLSPLQKLRAGLDLLLPRTLGPDDVGIGAFLERRLGRGIVDRLAGPLLGGVYGTRIADLSLDAVVPALRESERVHRSLLLASIAAGKARGHGGGSPFITLAGGIGALTDALVHAIGALSGVDVRIGSGVASLERSAAGTSVRLASGDVLRPEAILLATPATATARLVEPFAPAAAAQFRAIPYGSTGVVTLAYRDEQFPGPVTSHGFLVADDEPLAISAATITSRKWSGRSPDGTVLVRVFIGDRSEALLRSADDAVVAAARRDLETTLGVRGDPLLVRVTRWVDQMPHYTVGHIGRVDAALRALAPFPDITVAGSAYRGVGLPDCVAQGRAAARAILDGRAAESPLAAAGAGPSPAGDRR